MADEALRRADQLLTELIEIVETARTRPMSSSIVLPRERVLDLLDELRETMPPEMDEARRVIANRDALLHDAYETAGQLREQATAQGVRVLLGLGAHIGVVAVGLGAQARPVGLGLVAQRRGGGRRRLVDAGGRHQLGVLGAAGLDDLVGAHLGVGQQLIGAVGGVGDDGVGLCAGVFAGPAGGLVGVVQQGVAVGDDAARLVHLRRHRLAQFVEQVEHPLTRQDDGRRHGQRAGRLHDLDEFAEQLVGPAQGLVGQHGRLTPRGAVGSSSAMRGR